MGSVSRLEPSEVKSSLGHISKTKLLNNLDLKFSYSRQRNARACYKISIWIVNKISISSVSSHPPWVQCRIAGDGTLLVSQLSIVVCSTSEYSESSRSCLRPGPRSARQLPRAPRLAMSRRTATRPSSYCSDLDIDSLERRLPSNL